MLTDAPRVLIVDDDPDSALLAKSVLERRAGCVVVLADDRTSALQTLDDLRFDVVVADGDMDDLAGRGVITQVRRHDALVPIVVIAAAGIDPSARLRAQADEVLVAPLDVEHLVEVVRRLAVEGRIRRATA